MNKVQRRTKAECDLEKISQKIAERKQEAVQSITAKATIYVVFACTVSASAGLLFGYNTGISGGVSNMPSFQEKFFPHLYHDEMDSSYYCKHDDNILQLFASVMSFAGAAISVPGAHISKFYGRTMTMTVAGMAFVFGSIILGLAVRTSTLILGRVFWGIGVGLADQAATIYSSEMAPPHLRGTLTMLFQLCIVFGILVAQLLNIGTHFWRSNGWRISLGAAVVPGFVLLVAGLLLPETPNSLVERGYLARGRAVLESIRGTSEVDAEYGTIIAAHRREKAAGENQYITLMRREFRPHLAMNIIVPFAQQWTGINIVNFFSPFIFQSLGTKFQGELGSLLATVIAGTVQVLGTIVGILVVDKLGRRKTLIWSTIQIIIAQIALAIVLAVSTTSDTVTMSKVPAEASIVLICFFVFSYAYGWGPMGWVISAEVQPLETRCLGQGITVLVSLLNGAIIEQSFLTMLCSMEWGVYLLFAGCQVVATIFCIFFLPETTGIPIEHVRDVFRVHWYWKRFFDEEDEDEGMKAQREILALLKQRKEKAKEHNRSDSGGLPYLNWPARHGNDSDRGIRQSPYNSGAAVIEENNLAPSLHRESDPQ